MAADDFTDRELVLNRFRRLVGEVIRGATARNSFAPWELVILLDFEQCDLNPRRRLETLRQYQKAVERQLEAGNGPPMKLSDFLEQKRLRKLERAAVEDRLEGCVP